MESAKLCFFNPFAEISRTRNFLPHWQQPGATYFITFRLADAIPAELRDAWREERATWLKWHPKPWSEVVEKEYHTRFSQQVDEWMDAGHGECVLRDDACRGVVEAVLRFRDGAEYFLHAWVAMPNHVHVLVSLGPAAVLETTVGAWKSVSSRRIGKLVGRRGTLR